MIAQLTKSDIIQWLQQTYTEDELLGLIQEAKPNYLPADWEDDDSNFDDGEASEDIAYDNYGNGEAESEVRMQIEQALINKFFNELHPQDMQYWSTHRQQQLTSAIHRLYEALIGECMSDTIEQVFDCVKE